MLNCPYSFQCFLVIYFYECLVVLKVYWLFKVCSSYSSCLRAFSSCSRLRFGFNQIIFVTALIGCMFSDLNFSLTCSKYISFKLILFECLIIVKFNNNRFATIFLNNFNIIISSFDIFKCFNRQLSPSFTIINLTVFAILSLILFARTSFAFSWASSKSCVCKYWIFSVSTRSALALE